MTIIEFFKEDEHLLNIMSSLAEPAPNKVIYICFNSVSVESAIKRYRDILDKKGREAVELSYICVKNDLKEITKAIRDLIASVTDTMSVDLSGGDELVLVAMGIVYRENSMEPEGTRKDIQLHRFNIYYDKVSDCDRDRVNLLKGDIKLSVEERMSIYGGMILNTYAMSEDHISYALSIWMIAKADTTKWNSFTNDFKKAMYGDMSETMSVGVRKSVIDDYRNIFNLLVKYKLITMRRTDISYTVTFTNGFVMKCLTTAGTVLESVISYVASKAKKKDGSMLFNDIKQNVEIGWSDSKETKNEIDVILMKGLIPIFISCKNGNFSTDELYKLNSVSNKFGGSYVKKVLITSITVPENDNRRIKANEMDIRLIDDIDKVIVDRQGKMLNDFIRIIQDL